jgi:hypothetical protein
MSEKPKRKFWQFHLSTALILTIAASIILLLNIRLRDTEELIDHGGGQSSIEQHYGWPCTVYRSLPNYVLARSDVFDDLKSKWSFTGLLINATLSTSVLAIVILVSESIIRHRETRKT